MVDQHVVRVEAVDEVGDRARDPLRFPQQIGLAAPRLEPDRLQRTSAGRGKEVLDRRIAADDTTVRSRTETEQSPFEAIGLDPRSQRRTGGDDDPPSVVRRRTSEHRHRTVVRGVVGADDEQRHSNAGSRR